MKRKEQSEMSIRKSNIIIITGASSGIGREFFHQLDRGLYTVDEFWLVARRKDLLEELKEKASHPVKIIDTDLCTTDGIRKIKNLLQKEQPCIRMLINSAGYGIMGNFESLELEEQTGMIDLNCKALTEMTWLSLPYMKANSRIIQLASSAAFLPQPGFAIYAATKSYVLSFSRALNQELSNRKIFVTAVCPGPVQTEFFERAEKEASTLAIKKLTMAEAENVVRHALIASARKQETAVFSPLIKGFGLMTKLLPHGMILPVIKHLKS